MESPIVSVQTKSTNRTTTNHNHIENTVAHQWWRNNQLSGQPWSQHPHQRPLRLSKVDRRVTIIADSSKNQMNPKQGQPLMTKTTEFAVPLTNQITNTNEFTTLTFLALLL